MRINLSLDQIFGRNPREVGRLLRALGIDPSLPYTASVTFAGITIEQEIDQEVSAA